MQVVAAGMRHGHLAAIGVLAGSGARIVRTGVFPDRQRVHVGPQQNGRPAAVSQHADYAGAADAGTHFVAAPLQPLRSAPGGPLLLMGQLRVLVQVLIELFLGIPQARVAGQDLIGTAHDHPPPRGAHALGLIIPRRIQVGCLPPAGRRRARPGARSRGGGTPRRQSAHGGADDREPSGSRPDACSVASAGSRKRPATSPEAPKSTRFVITAAPQRANSRTGRLRTPGTSQNSAPASGPSPGSRPSREVGAVGVQAVQRGRSLSLVVRHRAAVEAPSGSQPPSFMRIDGSLQTSPSGRTAPSGVLECEAPLDAYDRAATARGAQRGCDFAHMPALDRAVGSRQSTSPASMSTQRRQPHRGDHTGPSAW